MLATIVSAPRAAIFNKVSLVKLFFKRNPFAISDNINHSIVSIITDIAVKMERVGRKGYPQGFGEEGLI